VEHLVYPGSVAIGAMPPATILVQEPEVSSLHARLQCYLGKSSEWEFLLIDNCSTNGTYVNGSRIERSLVRSGDKVRFSGVEFELRILEESPPRLTAPMR
jgi:pSer/pThr/pTyr-binding forkhead associated (FHA) protein